MPVSTQIPALTPPRAAAPGHTGRGAWLVGPRGAALVHGVSVVGGYLALLALLRGTWFRGDDFEFLANRVGPDPRFSVWMPHNEHWSTGPILIWRAVYDLFGMTSVMPYLVLSVAAHVVAAHLLWRLMRVLGVGAWPATGLAATFVVLGAGHENITWAFQLGFMGSLALGLGALLLLTRGTSASLAGAVAVSLVSLTFSGISVILVGMAVLYLLATRRWVHAALLGGVTGSAYLVWFALVGRFAGSPPHNQDTAERMANAAPWAWRALTSALEALVSAPGAGWLLALGLVLGVTWNLRRRTDLDGRLPDRVVGLLAAFIGGLLAQVGSLAISRGDVSLPETPRYVYVVVALLLPLVGLALSGYRGRVARGLVGLFLVYLVLTQGLVLVAGERLQEQPLLQRQVLGLAALTERGEDVFPTELAVDVNDETVGVWVERGDLGDLGAVPPEAVSDARALAEVRVESAPPRGADPGGLVSAGDEVVTDGCATTVTTPGDLAATLALDPSSTVSLTAEDGGEIAFQVVEPGPASRLVTVPVMPNQTYWFSTTEELTVDVVASQGQSLRICG